MRRIQKAFFSLFIVCMLCAVMPVAVSAASGELRFTDPSTTVGAEVEVTGKLSSVSNVKTLDATLTYDPEMLRFISGDYASGGKGTITIAGSGASTSIEFKLKFQALKEGTANIQVSQSTGTDSTDAKLEITNGSSAVTIGPGDPSLITEEEEGGETEQRTVSAEGPQVEVDGQQYKITSGFSDALIPSGFARSEIAFEGVTCEAVTQQAGKGESAVYLTPLNGGDPTFYLYNSDDGSFIPFEEVEIAADRYLVVLRDDGSVKLPSTYKETKLTLNGKEFTAWQDPTKAEYYVIYALNADGDKALYQYDTVDGTYQRYIPQTSSEDSGKKKAAKGIWGKILQFAEKMLDIVLIVGLLFMGVLVTALIVMGIKLSHRNAELDDLYEEYGIDSEDDEEEDMPVKKRKEKEAFGKGKKTSAKKKEDQPAVRVPVKTMNLREEGIFDDFEEYDDDDYDYDDYEFDDYEDISSDDGIGYEEIEEKDDEEEPGEAIDDLDELLSRQPKKKRGHMEKDDTFQVDFIDLD
ncbi:MAG: hypothetical protein HFG89_02265 [Dorea sp.]|jgi:hypothetical protein|nr:hypothetical protein [Dorea sp.]